MKLEKPPEIILFDGATGAGKSSLLGYLTQEFPHTVVVGTKLTTRPKRSGDNDWEFRFVERIPERHSRYLFSSLGNYYAVDYDSLLGAISRHMVYAVSCVDRRTIENLKSEFEAVTVYVYRSWAPGELEQVLFSRGITDSTELRLRQDEVTSIAEDYVQKVDLYDHVVLNVGSKTNMKNQLITLMGLYGLTTNTASENNG